MRIFANPVRRLHVDAVEYCVHYSASSGYPLRVRGTTVCNLEARYYPLAH